MQGLQDFLQSASNEAAGTVSMPVDAIAWLLQKAGLPVNKPVGGSDWMAERGLTKPVQQNAASLAGQTVGMLSPAVAAAKAPQIARGLLQAGENLASPTARGMVGGERGAVVFHGSPHKFDKFDSSKIGTGEGAQAYGHGLYLAENPSVATEYSKMNPTVLQSPVRAFKGAELTAGTPEYHAATLLDSMGLQQAKKTVAGWIANADPSMVKEAEGWAKTLETLNAATSKADFKKLKNTGSLYKVDLPDEKIARMLDWDKPLSQQSKTIQEFFEPVIAQRRALEAQVPTASERAAWGELAEPQVYDPLGKDALFAFGKGRNEWAASPAAAKMLRDRGIPGIRYLDGGSRGAGAGTSNYVVFPGEEDALKILERNGQALGLLGK